MQTRDQINSYQRAYYAKNKELMKLYPSHKSEKRLAANRRWHQDNKPKTKASRKQARDAYRDRNIAWFQSYKRGLSCPCGESDSRCLDFHHRDPATKEFTIRNGVNRGITRMLAEIAKCDVLCANCHRKVTYPHLA